MTPMPAPPVGGSWADESVWWHVYPLGFTGAERRAAEGGAPTHRLAHLEAWLDYAADLGCTGLALGPIFASETHGYDTVDHFRIDPRLGDDDDFDRLAAAVHDRGLRLLLDGVFNHVGRGFPPLADVLARGGASPHAGWFRRSGPTGPDGASGLATFEGHDHLVALDHDAAEVVAYVAGVMNHWLGRGADGWRLDAAYAVPARFWRRVLARVRPGHPQAWFVGEVIHGDYGATVARSGLDSVTQYELWKAIWSSLNDVNLFELAWALDRHNRFLESFVPMTFVGNHDVTRIASRLADPGLLTHALVVLLTVGGVPSIYAGDEQAFRGVKEDRAGGDDAVRPAFPPTPAGLADAGWPVHRRHRDLIGVRRRRPWLARATTEVTTLTNEVLAYTSHRGDDRLGVVLNIGDAPFAVPEPVGGIVARSDATTGPAPAAGATVVGGHGWLVFEGGRP
jgi:cyclomaltodextrinase